MKAIKFIVVTVMLLLFALPLSARQELSDPDSAKTEAVKAFEQILDLWRAGDFGRLYDKTTVNGKDTKESFSRKMATAQLKPSCCWEKMQDVTASVKSATAVMVKAKIGLDAPGEMEYKTKSFKMVNEFGEWRIPRSEILSLAEVGKIKKTKKHRPKVIN